MGIYSGGFTATPNHVMGLVTGLPGSQAKVLAFITRRTLGWHKDWDCISLSQFTRGVGREPGTGLARNTIIAAVRALEAQGLIQCMRLLSAAGDCAPTAYRLTPAALGQANTTASPGPRHVHPLNHGGGAAAEPTEENSISTKHPSSINPCLRRADDDFLRTATTCQVSTAAREASTSAPEGRRESSKRVSDSPPLEVTAPPQEPSSNAATHLPAHPEDAAVSIPTERREGLTEADGLIHTGKSTNGDSRNGLDTLCERLRAVGLSVRLAEDTLRRYELDHVRRALDNLPHRNARNPAAYLLAELKAGDFAPPVSKRTVRGMRLASPSPEDVVRMEHPTAESDGINAAAAALDDGTRAALIAEARRRCIGLGRKLADDSPLLQAQFELLVQERMTDGVTFLLQCA